MAWRNVTVAHARGDSAGSLECPESPRNGGGETELGTAGTSAAAHTRRVTVERVGGNPHITSVPYTPRKATLASLYGESVPSGRTPRRRTANSGAGQWPRILHPDQRRQWNLVVLVAIVYSAIEMPFVICFFECVTLTDWFFFTMVGLDVLFLTDMLLNFYTGFRHDGQVIMDHAQIVRRYLLSFEFVVDLLSILPISYIGIGHQCRSLLKTTRIFKVTRIFRLVRLFRLQRFFRYAASFTEQFTAGAVRIANLVMLLIMFTHWNGCLYFMLGQYNSGDEDSWIHLAGIADADLQTQYSVSLFASWSQMLCIGYGTVTPVLVSELWFTLWSMTSGYALFSGIVAAITTVFMLADSSGQKYICHMNEVEAFMAQHGVPPKLRGRVRDYMEAKYTKPTHSDDLQGAPKMFDVGHILSEFSVGLRREVRNHLTSSLAARVPFLHSAFELPDEVGQFLLQHLRPELGLRGDVVVQQGEPASFLFFIEDGTVELDRDGQALTRLQGGSYFGEMPLALERLRLQPMTVTVKSPECRMHSLAKPYVQQLFKLFPDMHTLMHMVASQRIQTFGLQQAMRLNAPSDVACVDTDHIHSSIIERESIMRQLFDSMHLDLTPPAPGCSAAALDSDEPLRQSQGNPVLDDQPRPPQEHYLQTDVQNAKQSRSYVIALDDARLGRDKTGSGSVPPQQSAAARQLTERAASSGTHL